TRSGALVRLPGRTRTARCVSGALRRIRSTSAVPRKPVAPVTAMRLPARASAIIAYLSTSDEVEGQDEERRPEDVTKTPRPERGDETPDGGADPIAAVR